MAGDRFIELASGDNRHVLDVLFHHASEAITVQDRGGRVVYANPRAAALVGASSESDLLNYDGREIVSTFEMVDESGSTLDPDHLPGPRVLQGGVAVSEMVVGYRKKGDQRSVRWSRVRASPVKNDAGEVVWAINFSLDITEHVQRAESERLLATIQEVLGSSIEVEAVADALADVVVPRFADWVGVHVLDDSGYLRSVAMRYPDTEIVEKLFAIIPQDILPVGQDHMQSRVVASREAETLTITDEVLAGVSEEVSPELAEALRSLELISVVCLPLRTTHEVIGTLTVARSGSDTPFDSSDVSLLSTIADRAGVALANAILFAHQHELAQAVSRGLQPREIPHVPGLTMSVRYRPYAHISKVGGDFYDVIPLSPERCAIIVGDIEGKGTSAAGVVATARNTLKATIALDPSARTVVERLNATLLAEVPPRLCTLAYLLVERHGDSVEVEVSLAGHPPPLVLRSDGSVTEAGRPSPPAGVLERIEPFEDRLMMSSGDILLAYTDGLLAGHDSSVDALKARLSRVTFGSIDDLLDMLIETVEEAVTGFHDDVVLVAFMVD
jgi:PAS domain S-box-containing protein